LLTTVYWLWWANQPSKELPVTDREAFFVAAVAAVGLTILWLDWRKTWIEAHHAEGSRHSVFRLPLRFHVREMQLSPSGNNDFCESSEGWTADGSGWMV